MHQASQDETTTQTSAAPAANETHAAPAPVVKDIRQMEHELRMSKDAAVQRAANAITLASGVAAAALLVGVAAAGYNAYKSHQRNSATTVAE